MVETFQICVALISERGSDVINTFCNTEESATPNWIFFSFVLSIFLSVFPKQHFLLILVSDQLLSMFFFTLTSHQIDWTGVTFFTPTHFVNKIIHTIVMDDFSKRKEIQLMS